MTHFGCVVFSFETLDYQIRLQFYFGRRGRQRYDHEFIVNWPNLTGIRFSLDKLKVMHLKKSSNLQKFIFKAGGILLKSLFAL